MRPSALVYELRVTLLDVEPPVWRRLRVPADIALARLHRVLQIVMGWEDRHAWHFEAADRRYGVTESELDDFVPAKGVRLRQLATDVGMDFLYEYDPDTGWEHLVRVERILPPDPFARLPYCVEGARACPPEDVGGPYAYEEFVAAIRDPDHPERAAAFAWQGGPVNAEWFDVSAVNEALEKLR